MRDSSSETNHIANLLFTSARTHNGWLQKSVSDDILKTRNEQENITLEIDKILFDNSIMLNQIIKNFNTLMQIIE